MNDEAPKKSGKGLIIAASVAAAIVAWYAFRPERLFIDARVNESFPGAAMAQSGPGAEARVLASGMFHGVAHATKGTAAVHQFSGGRRVLRLTDFETSNGPDVQVYLVAAPDAMDDATVKQAGFVPLGALKGNIGDQNYDIPAEVDLSKHRAVTIWCRRFGVNFGTAPLMEGGSIAYTRQMAEPRALLAGQFHGVAHEASGTASILQLDSGAKILRLSDFKTSNGPDLRVYLVAANDAADSDAVKQAGFVDLAALKGNVGDQNYELPADIDLSTYRAVTIWCRRFGVNFATAPLVEG